MAGAVPLQRNQLVELTVDRLGMDAEGVCRWGEQGLAVFVPLALPGERIEARIVKVEKRHAFARLERVLTPSPERAEPRCPVYRRCGGCAAQHMAYAATLAFKRAQVQDCLARIGHIALDVPPVWGMDAPWQYRNKGAFPVAAGDAQDAGVRIGFYARRSHAVVDAPAGCPVQREASDAAVSAVRHWMVAHRVPPYDEATHTGCVRHIMTRVTQDGQVMVVMVSLPPRMPAEEALVARLRQDVPGLASVVLSHNPRQTNVILGDTLRTLWGTDALEDVLHGLRFRVSPRTFFQVNPAQTERLYAQALQYAALTGEETVVDAYCGAGTISLLLAQRARRVVGIEVVPEAIADARHNATQNGIDNAEFLVGETERILPALVAQGMHPEVVVLDPPRKGCDPAVLHAVARAAPRRVVYVSCNPATLARDAALLVAAGYRAAAAQPVDMFCWAGDIETVLLLVRTDEV